MSVAITQVSLKISSGQASWTLSIIAITSATFYWYYIPETLNQIFGDPDTLSIVDVSVYWLALSFVLLTHLSLVLALAILSRIWSRPVFHHDVMQINGRMSAIAFISATLSFVCFTQSLLSGGISATTLLMGDGSARSYMNFQNTSAGASQSLFALLEIITFFLTTFVAVFMIVTGRFFSFRFSISLANLALLFASNGTRSLVLMFLFCCLLAAAVSRQKVQHDRRVSFFHITLTLLVILAFLTLAINVSSARFSSDATQANFIWNSFGAHNNMLSQLVTSIQLDPFIRQDPFWFLYTPFSFLTPSFIGFEKQIPTHLIDFNVIQANIDLLYGAGNVFPGLHGDMFLNFSYYSPFVMIVYLVFLVLIIQLFTVSRSQTVVGLSAQIVLLGFIGLSYRNLQGGLGIGLMMSLFTLFFLRLSRKN